MSTNEMVDSWELEPPEGWEPDDYPDEGCTASEEGSVSREPFTVPDRVYRLSVASVLGEHRDIDCCGRCEQRVRVNRSSSDAA
jgi:hypothetical protein